ncbi:MAG: heavy metal translocating P-type ATPase, partial [Slackia sp.]|nr:heavy metal translocating P-type ATPase [Slackia sp.]
MESLKPLFEPLTNLLDRRGVRKDVAFIILSAIALLCSFLAPDDVPIDPAWIAIILCGLPIVTGAFVALVTEFDVKADLLVSIALVASIAIGQYFAAGEVALIMQLGALLEERTVARAQRGIERLVELTPRTARLVLEDGEERIVEAEAIERLQVVRVLPGEYVPVDGVVTKGCTSVDESVLTGESMPVDKQEGDEVSSGSLNQFGTIEVRALRVGEDGSIQRMARLVQSADAGKAKIVRLADRWATWIVVGALTAAAGAYLITGDIVRSVTVLVVFCPCSLVLATPTAIVAAIGNATKHGFLVKEGDALERLSGVKEAAFDKTGTLTKGTPEVLGVVAIPGGRFTDESLYEVLAGAESRSEHPLGKAIVACARRAGTIIPEPEEFRMIPGRGVEARVSGSKVSVGNARMMQEAGLVTEEWRDAGVEAFEQEGCTVSYIAVEGEATGVVALTDALRDESVETMRALYALGVY